MTQSDRVKEVLTCVPVLLAASAADEKWFLGTLGPHFLAVTDDWRRIFHGEVRVEFIKGQISAATVVKH